MIYLQFFLYLMLAVISDSAEARFVENGQICHYVGKHRHKSCRDPLDSGEIQRVLEEERQWNMEFAIEKRYDLCQFSMFKGWSSEQERLRGKIKSEQNILEFINKERYWASEDIRKSNVLPSETVRSAYGTLALYNGMAATANEKLSLYSWCLECAKRQPKNYKDCK
jgi:hypothetical protein